MHSPSNRCPICGGEFTNEEDFRDDKGNTELYAECTRDFHSYYIETVYGDIREIINGEELVSRYDTSENEVTQLKDRRNELIREAISEYTHKRSEFLIGFEYVMSNIRSSYELLDAEEQEQVLNELHKLRNQIDKWEDKR